MKPHRIVSSLAFVLCLSCAPFSQSARGQAVAGDSAVTAAQSPTPERLVLKEGADVPLKFAQDLSSKTSSEGDSVNLVLDEDLKVGDVVIVKGWRQSGRHHHPCQEGRNDGQGR
jgi:hypothetical protein